MLSLNLQIHYQDAHTPPRKKILDWLTTTLKLSPVKNRACRSVTVRIVDATEMTDLNFSLRGKPKPTNVLSIPDELIPGEKLTHWGDIAICPPVLLQEAGNSPVMIEAHWAHLVVHAMLHLQGFDHIEESDAVKMEALETTILKSLGFPDPYTL